MFGAPLTEQEVLPAKTAPQAQPYGFEQALSDVLDFLGMGGTEQATANQLANEQEAEAKGLSPYQPQESANMVDRRNEQPDPLSEAYKRYGDNPKEAAARISLMPRGVAPFVSAAYDIATGQNNPRGLSLGELYRKRQTEATALEEDQAPASRMVREYAPYAVGPIIGAFAPGKAGKLTDALVGTAVKGGLAGGIAGGTQGYFQPRNDGMELSDPRRIESGLKQGGLGALMGMTTGAATHGAIEVAKQGFRQPQRAISNQVSTNQPAVTQAAEKAVESTPSRSAAREARYEARFQEDIGRFAKTRMDQGQDLASIAYELEMTPNQLARSLEMQKVLSNSPKYDRIRAEMNDILGPKPQPQPQGLNQAVAKKPAPAEAPQPAKAVEPPKPAPKPEAAPKPAKLSPEDRAMREDLRGNTARGKQAQKEVDIATYGAQAKADFQARESLRNPPSAREMLAQSGRVPAKVTPDKPQPTAPSSAPAEKGSFKPSARKGVMQIADDVSTSVGRSPGKWTNADREEFVKNVARHTEMKPAQIKNLLKSYGTASRASPGLSNTRIKEILEAERTAEKVKPKKE